MQLLGKYLCSWGDSRNPVEILKWLILNINCQKYPVYTEYISPSPKFSSVSLYNQPFSRYKVSENRKCTGRPQNDLWYPVDTEYLLQVPKFHSVSLYDDCFSIELVSLYKTMVKVKFLRKNRETTYGESNNNITFDLEWPWKVKV